jgi:YidC/Oxa1 family membrane protein insertase
MAELPDGQKRPNASPSPSQAPLERRLLLAFLLMGGVLLLTPYFYKYVSPPPPPGAAKQTTVAGTAEPKAPAPAPPSAPAPAKAKPAQAARAAPQVVAEKEDTFTIDTDLYRIELSNRGGTVRSWILKKYKDSAGKPLQLVNLPGAAKAGYPFSLDFGEKKPAVDLNQVLFSAKPAPDGLGIEYRFSDGKVEAGKSFRFQRDRYLSEFSSGVTQDGAGVEHLVRWPAGFGDPAVPNPAATQHSLYYDLSAQKLIVHEAKAAKDGPLAETGAYSFAGLEDNYFAAVFLPQDRTQTQVRTLSDTVPGLLNPQDQPHVGVAVGGAPENEFAVFVGPKDVEILRTVDPKLEQLVDWGWFGFIAKPLFLILNWINKSFVHNFGWSIVIVTIIINFALLPLKLTSMKSMKKMQALQPQIQAINAKYKNVGLRDPRKAQQNQETMELYKRNGVNPMGGCIPMLIQIPFFFAFYKVLMVAIQLRGANWLWVTDLSQPEHLPIRILPIAMIVSQFVMQKMTPTATTDPTQQKMMLIMPLVFGFMFYQFQSGLVLYWLTSNLVGIAQQWLINKTTPAVVVQPEPAKRKK